MNTPNPSAEAIAEAVNDVLVSVTGVPEIRDANNLKIRELGILDSLGVVSLILALGERFDLTIAPTEIEETDVATPAAVARFVQAKLNATVS